MLHTHQLLLLRWLQRTSTQATCLEKTGHYSLLQQGAPLSCSTILPYRVMLPMTPRGIGTPEVNHMVSVLSQRSFSPGHLRFQAFQAQLSERTLRALAWANAASHTRSLVMCTADDMRVIGPNCEYHCTV